MEDTRIIMRLDGEKKIFSSIEAGRLAGAITCDEYNQSQAKPAPEKKKVKVKK